jgi:RHS repeat-associated protein
VRWTVRDNGDRSTPRSPFGVTGELQDGQTGLVSLRARWDDPAQGRFLQRDRFTGGPTRPQSLNRYAYTENNPVNWTDPSGRCVGWVWRDPTCQFIGQDRILRGDLEWGDALDPLQVGLDVVGLVPGFGEPADGLNGGISLLRGDRVGAALSFASMVPFAGWGATVAKWGRRGMRLGDAGRVARQSREQVTAFSRMRTASVDFLEQTGRLGGILYGERRLAKLKNYLDRQGVDLFVGDEYVPRNKGGAFRVPLDPGQRPAMILRSNPTQYEVWHELSHYIHYQRIGREAFINLPRSAERNAAEQFVFDMLENNERRWWGRLNEAERQHAIDSILDPDTGGIR